MQIKTSRPFVIFLLAFLVSKANGQRDSNYMRLLCVLFVVRFESGEALLRSSFKTLYAWSFHRDKNETCSTRFDVHTLSMTKQRF